MNIIEYAFLGFAVIIVAAYIRRVQDKYVDFCIAISMPIFLILLVATAPFLAWVRPHTVDGTLRQIDLALGLDGLALTRWLFHVKLYFLVAPVYGALPLMMALAWALERDQRLLRACCIGPFFAFPFYLLVPAAGPQYAFVNFPLAVNHLMSVGSNHLRNCFPSMHFGWAFLLALGVKDWRWRWAFILYAFLMVFAPVAGGEHYFIDIIAAVPFTFGVTWVAERWPLGKRAAPARISPVAVPEPSAAD